MGLEPPYALVLNEKLCLSHPTRWFWTKNDGK